MFIVKYTNRQVLKIAQAFVSFAHVHFTYWLFLRFADPLVDYIYPLKDFTSSSVFFIIKYIKKRKHCALLCRDII